MPLEMSPGGFAYATSVDMSTCLSDGNLLVDKRSGVNTMEQTTEFGNTFVNIHQRVRSITIIDAPPPKLMADSGDGADDRDDGDEGDDGDESDESAENPWFPYWAEDVGKWCYMTPIHWYPTAARAVPTATSLQQHGYASFDDLLPLDHLSGLRDELAGHCGDLTATGCGSALHGGTQQLVEHSAEIASVCRCAAL